MLVPETPPESEVTQEPHMNYPTSPLPISSTLPILVKIVDSGGCLDYYPGGSFLAPGITYLAGLIR